MKTNFTFTNLKSLLLSTTDNCGLFPIVTRIGIYGLLLTTIIYFQSSYFDATELITIVMFCSIVTMIELAWKNIGFGKRLIWHLVSLIVLIGFLGVLLNQAMVVREAWYRTHVLEERINELIQTSPTAVIVSDGRGRIKYINKHTTDMIGWTTEELKGQSLTILMRPHKVPKHEEAFYKEVAELKEGSAKWIYVGDRIFRIVCKDKSLVRVQIYIVGVRFSNDREPGVYPLGQDIEFYAIIQPIKPAIDLEDTFEKVIERNKEKIEDIKEEADAVIKKLQPK